MRKIAIILILIGVLVYEIYQNNLIEKFQEYITLKHMVHLSSSAFSDNGLIPPLYTCDGQGINPPLDITGVEGNAQSLVLIVEDPDAPGRTYTHWVLYNIPPITTSIPEKSIPQNARQGKATDGSIGYVPACPPTGTHRYIFTLYVLDTSFNLPEGSTNAELLDAMKDHIIDKTQLIGRYTKAN